MQITVKNGLVFDLPHMDSFKLDLDLVLDGQVHQFQAIVMFSNHCYTARTDDPNDPFYLCTDSTGHRYVCPIRLAESVNIPARVRELFKDNRTCYRLKDGGNFVRVNYKNAKDKFAGLYLFFSYERARESSCVLKINVESMHDRSARPGNMRGDTLYRSKDLMRDWILHRSDLLERVKNRT